MRSQIALANQKLNSDQVYIRRLHEYNWLKDAAFELVERLALIEEKPAKAIFAEYDVRDTETCHFKK